MKGDSSPFADGGDIEDHGSTVDIEFFGDRANGISRTAKFPSGRKATQQEREEVINSMLYDAIPELEMRIHDFFNGFPTFELSEKYKGQDLRDLTNEQKREVLQTAEDLIQQIMGSPLSDEGRELLRESRYGEMPEETASTTEETTQGQEPETADAWTEAKNEVGIYTMPGTGKSIQILASIPDGWQEDKGALTIPKGYVMIHNNKSRFSGERKIALVPESEAESESEQINARTSWPAGTSVAESQSIVEFLSTANKSSGFHELWHHVFRVLTDAANLEDASDLLKQDVGVILKNAGVTWEDFYSNAGDSRRIAHEFFAKSGEAYLREGKAPTPELAGAFERIKQWLVEIYKNIKESLEIELNDEMRDIFDRLLATPEQLTEQKSYEDIQTLYQATEAELQRIQVEIQNLEEQMRSNSQEWENVAEQAFIRGKNRGEYYGIKEGREYQRKVDKAKLEQRIAQLKQNQKLMKERQRERKRIRDRVKKIRNAIKRMSQSQSIIWGRQQEIKNLLDTYDFSKDGKLSLRDHEFIYGQVKDIYDTGKRELAAKKLITQERVNKMRQEIMATMQEDWDKRPRGAVRHAGDTSKEYNGLRGKIGSFPRVLPYAGPTAMLNAIAQFMRDPTAFIEECYRLDPQLENRKGDPLISELRKGAGTGYDTLLATGNYLIGVSDRVASAIVWKAVYDANIRQGLSHDDAVKQAQRVVLLTQPVTHVKDKPLIWQQHGWARLAMMFTNDMAQTFGESVYDLVQGIRRGDVKETMYRLTGLTLAAVMLKLISSGLPDEPDEPEEWGKWVMSAFVENELNSVPVIGKGLVPLWDYKRSMFGSQDPFIAPFAKLMAGAGGLWDDKNDNDERAIFNLIEGAALLSPFPATGLKRLWNTGRELGHGEILLAFKRAVGTRVEDRKLRKSVSF